MNTILKFTAMRSNVLMLSMVFSGVLHAQTKTLKTLFLGNSYTSANDLPQMVHDVALSVGDTLIFDSNTPGGQTLREHAWYDQVTLQKIGAEDWDYIVLQEQSLFPSLPCEVRQDMVYSAVQDLIGLFPKGCTKTMFYMTWGRKNGDSSFCPSWPPSCSYSTMDSVIQLAYMEMSEFRGEVSPVGAVWRYIRNTYPEIELYAADESHPSLAGTYAAACTFYAALYRKDPMAITFNPGIDPVKAQQIRIAAHAVVSQSPEQWRIGYFDPKAQFFCYLPEPDQVNQVQFNNSSIRYASCFWDFGDGGTSTETNPLHVYATEGNYTVTLAVSDCNAILFDTMQIQLNVGGVLLAVSDYATAPNEPVTYLNNDTLFFELPSGEESVTRKLLIQNFGTRELVCEVPEISGVDAGLFSINLSDSLYLSTMVGALAEITYQPDVVTNHTALLTLLSNDTASSPFQLVLIGTLDLVASIEDRISAIDDVVIYPNPGWGQFTIRCGYPIESVALYNMAGRQEFERRYNDIQNSQVLNIDLPPGLYMAAIKTEAGIFYKKLVCLK